MPDNTMRDDLKEAGEHVKDALRASLLAARKAIDVALEKLGDEEPRRGPSGDPADSMTPRHGPDEGPSGQPPPAPPDV